MKTAWSLVVLERAGVSEQADLSRRTRLRRFSTLSSIDTARKETPKSPTSFFASFADHGHSHLDSEAFGHRWQRSIFWIDPTTPVLFARLSNC